MDRELCVLVYSQYSQASKHVIDFIQTLSYDLAAITGMSLLAADTQEIRDKLKSLNISSVPCIFVKYFDGTTALYEENLVYSFIDSVTKSVLVVPFSNIPITQNDTAIVDLTLEENPPTAPRQDANFEIYERDNVMEAAKSLRQAREAEQEAINKPQVGGVGGVSMGSVSGAIKKRRTVIV